MADESRQRLGCFWLLDPDNGVREAAADGLHEQARQGALVPAAAALLPVLRSWLPEGPVRERVDETIRSARRQGGGVGQAVAALPVEAAYLTPPDGVGAMQVVLMGRAVHSEDTWHIGSVLVKGGFGLGDAYVLEGLSAAHVSELTQGLQGLGLRAADLADCRTVVADGLGESTESGKLPPPSSRAAP